MGLRQQVEVQETIDWMATVAPGVDTGLTNDEERLALEGLRNLANDQPLTEDQHRALEELADQPLNPTGQSVWDQLEAAGVDSLTARGAIYQGLQESAQDAAVAAGRSSDTVPMLDGDTNAILVGARDLLESGALAGSLTAAQQAEAIAGLDNLLNGEPVTQAQQAAIQAARDPVIDFNVAANPANANLDELMGIAFDTTEREIDDAQAAIAAAPTPGGGGGVGGTPGGPGGTAGGGMPGLPGTGTPGTPGAPGGISPFNPADFFAQIPQGGGNVPIIVVPNVPLVVGPQVVASPTGGDFGGGAFAGAEVGGGDVGGDVIYEAPSAIDASPAPDLESSGTVAVTEDGSLAQQPGPGEGKYDRRYLSVRNNTSGMLAVFVQYETIQTSTNQWKWYPNEPGGAEATAWTIEAGQEVDLRKDDWPVNARRVRIWAVTESGERFDTYRETDLWLVAEQSNGERFYISQIVETFPVNFGDRAE